MAISRSGIMHLLRRGRTRRRAAFFLFVCAACVSMFSLGNALGERLAAGAFGDTHAIAEGYVWAAQTVVNGMIFLAFYALLFGRMSYGALLPSLALGEAAYSSSWFIGSVHRRLLEYPIYTELFGHEITGFVNPQYGMMAVFLGVMALLVISIGFARFLPGYRFSRVAAALVMVSIALTGWFFHDQTVKSLDIADQGERKVLVSALSVDEFLDACRSSQVLCYEDPDINSEITGMEPVDEQLVGPLLYFAGKKFERSVHTLSGMGSSRDARARFFVAAIVVEGSNTRVGVSVHRPAERLDFERCRLSLQMLAAHLTWLFGGVFISNLHKPKKGPKVLWADWEYDPEPTSTQQVAVESETDLLLAVERRNASRVRDLLAAGDDPNGVPGFAPIAAAVWDDDLTIARDLLKAAADPNGRLGTETALMLSSLTGRMESVDLLLEFGAEPDLRDSVGMTALHYAASADHWTVVLRLLKAGASIHSVQNSGISLAHYVALASTFETAHDRRDFEIVRKLVEEAGFPSDVPSLQEVVPLIENGEWRPR